MYTKLRWVVIIYDKKNLDIGMKAKQVEASTQTIK